MAVEYALTGPILSHTNCFCVNGLGLLTETACNCNIPATVQRMRSVFGRSVGSRSMRSGLADINVLARGASNAKWHSGCLAPDRCVESICDWLIRGPLFFARTTTRLNRYPCLLSLRSAATTGLCTKSHFVGGVSDADLAQLHTLVSVATHDRGQRRLPQTYCAKP